MCFSSEHPDRIPLPAGETFFYKCELDVHRPGPFEAKLKFYVHDRGIREIEVTVRGVGVDPGTKHAPPQP